MMIQLDLSSVFDTIDQNLLMEILAKMLKIEEGALELIQSSLKERTSSILINECMSSKSTLKYGIPQG